MRPALVVAALAAGASLFLGACGGPDITAARVEDAIGPAFAQLYARQGELLGKGTDAGAAASASCSRSNGKVNATGAGNDWICQLLLQESGKPSSVFTYDLTVQANGCYSADGPPALVGGHTLKTPTGQSRVNPLFIIDGCFDEF